MTEKKETAEENVEVVEAKEEDKPAEEKAEEKEEKAKEAKKETETKESKAKVSSSAGKSAAEIIETIKGMSVLELSELVKELEETFGVTAAAPVAAAPAAGGAAAPAEEEKSFYDVILSSVGDKKIQVIKVVRSLTGLGLKEAKAVVDEAPKPVKEKVSKEEAEKMKKELEDAGATVELK